jgi:indolepyruvate ferredoxin oxidoreductase
MPANMIAMGAAFQRGALPVSAASMEAAIRLNGAAVERNLAAFAWGRACVAAPDAVARARAAALPVASTAPTAASRALVARAGAPAGSELERLLELRVPELSSTSRRPTRRATWRSWPRS